MADTYAVVRSGGKQYTVTNGKTIAVERMRGEVGDAVTFSEVLLLNKGGTVTVGSPFIAGVSVSGTIVAQTKDKRVLSYRKKIKTGFTKKIGHRHERTQVRIEAVAG